MVISASFWSDNDIIAEVIAGENAESEDDKDDHDMDESTATTSPSTNEIEDSLEAMQDLFIFSAHESEFCCLLLKTETFYTSSPSLISRVCCLMSKPQALDVKKGKNPRERVENLKQSFETDFSTENNKKS